MDATCVNHNYTVDEKKQKKQGIFGGKVAISVKQKLVNGRHNQVSSNFMDRQRNN